MTSNLTFDFHQRFLDVVAKFRKHEIPLEPDTPLLSVGIDSLDTISLLVEIEAVLDIRISDDMLSPEAFDSIGTLWQVVERCIKPNRL
jgi:acyl carrier protein